MFWQPCPIFDGDVFIIGGGPSLEGFDWSLIKGRQVIGCNDAYTLGDWVTVCHFGDWNWYRLVHKKNLDRWGNLKITSFWAHKDIRLEDGSLVQPAREAKGILVMQRDSLSGFCVDGKLAWNGNTGISSINLAAYLGASRIILLGFDMKRSKGKHNWHPNPRNPADIFHSFLKRAENCKRDM